MIRICYFVSVGFAPLSSELDTASDMTHFASSRWPGSCLKYIDTSCKIYSNVFLKTIFKFAVLCVLCAKVFQMLETNISLKYFLWVIRKTSFNIILLIKKELWFLSHAHFISAYE